MRNMEYKFYHGFKRNNNDNTKINSAEYAVFVVYIVSDFLAPNFNIMADVGC